MASKQLSVIFITVLFKASYGFLFDVDGICQSLQSTCMCNEEYIKCSNRNLLRIPSFNISKQYNMSFLRLQHNRITTISSGAFKGIHTKTMYIDLSYNDIHNIQHEAFEGVETAVTILNLRNNRLTILPDALAILTKLIDLNILNNPIKTFSDAVMFSLGPNLEILTMGSTAMTEWPTSFQYLKQLNTLKVFDLAINDLSENAFASFAGSLKNLQIDNTGLAQIPNAICDLSNLEAFQFNNNKNLSEDILMPNCSSPLDSVKILGLTGNGLTEMPDIFYDFPNLTTIYIVGNHDLVMSNWNDIPQDTKISNLYLYNNGFHLFPSEVRQFHTLKFLDLHANNITRLAKDDVKGLTSLLKLNLNDNPLKYIDDILQNLPNLTFLALDNTDIEVIPEAIKYSATLETVSLKNDNIICTCGALPWLKNWKRAQFVNFIGTCGYLSYQQSIADYVTTFASTC